MLDPRSAEPDHLASVTVSILRTILYWRTTTRVDPDSSSDFGGEGPHSVRSARFGFNLARLAPGRTRAGSAPGSRRLDLTGLSSPGVVS